MKTRRVRPEELQRRGRRHEEEGEARREQNLALIFS
jgi:hypothetical protein